MALSDISLTTGMRANLLSLRDSSARIDRTQERLSTGKRVNSALDNPTNFFAARAHLNRADDLNNLKDGIKEAIQVVRSADAGMTAMTSVFRQASAIAENAMQSENVGELTSYITLFNEMRAQVDMLAADSGYRGTNLLHRNDLIVDFGNDHNLTITGSDVTSSGFDQMTNGLGVEAASMDPLNIVTPNFVLNAFGAIKEDGKLTIANNDVPDIDNWLGAAGIKNQIITSQNVTLSSSPSLSDGRTVTSQILDNVGVAEYGTKQFELYRDTSVNIINGAGYALDTAINNLHDVSEYLGPLQGSGSQAISIQKTPSITGYHVITGVGGSLSPPPTIDDATKLAAYLDQPVTDPGPTLIYDSATQQWSVQSPLPLTLIQNGSPPTSLGLVVDGSGVPAATINLSGAWNNNDRIRINLSSWSAADPDVNVSGTSGSTKLEFWFGPLTVAAFSVNLNTNQYNIPAGTDMTLAVEASDWKATDPAVTLKQPTGTGAMTADLNGDGTDDIQINLPTDGPNGATWLSTERVLAATTGAFRTTDPTVTLKYDHDLKTIALILAGGNGGADITISLSDSWAVNDLPTSPLGNGDNIHLTVDGRHRWVKGDGVTPNAAGMRLSMSEVEEAISTLRLNAARNSAGLSILSVRNDFTNNIVTTLGAGADNLTLADMDEEGANMLMLQTRQNLGITSLSLASQAAQAVVRLFS